MESSRQQRKTELAAYLVKVLNELHLTKTANTLKDEAKLNDRPNIQEQIESIKRSSSDQTKRKELIKHYFVGKLKKHLKDKEMSKALNLFENYIPLYVDDLQLFSLMFAENYQQEEKSIDHLLHKFFVQNSQCAQKRVSCLQYQSQIWFLKALGKSILAIDDKACGRVLTKDIVSAQRIKLHQSKVFCVSTSSQGIFATGGDDKLCRVWNIRLQLLYEFSKHSHPISAICFINDQIASFDSSGTIIITTGVSSAVTSNNSLPCVRLKGIAYTDVKYIHSKNGIIGVGNPEGRGRLDLADLQNRRCSSKLLLTEKIYNIELSFDQKLVFLNLSSMTIHAYTTSKFKLSFQVVGYQQAHCLMRMSVGGSNKDVLAVTSEEGCVCLYSIKKKALIKKVKGTSQKAVNCVQWLENDLFFGCDGGCIQHWGEVGSNGIGPSEKNGNSKMKEEMIQSSMVEEEGGDLGNQHELQQME